MDNDELERVMNFIIKRQENGAEQLAQAETIINALAKSQLHACRAHGRIEQVDANRRPLHHGARQRERRRVSPMRCDSRAA